jgi:hypothetical protein
MEHHRSNLLHSAEELLGTNAMSGFIEQLCVGPSGAPQVLKRSPWTGPPLGGDQFREIAYTILNDERRAAVPKDGAAAMPKGPSGCETVRFVREDGSEQYRYGLSDLENDNRTKPGASEV